MTLQNCRTKSFLTVFGTLLVTWRQLEEILSPSYPKTENVLFLFCKFERFIRFDSRGTALLQRLCRHMVCTWYSRLQGASVKRALLSSKNHERRVAHVQSFHMTIFDNKKKFARGPILKFKKEQNFTSCFRIENFIFCEFNRCSILNAGCVSQSQKNFEILQPFIFEKFHFKIQFFSSFKRSMGSFSSISGGDGTNPYQNSASIGSNFSNWIEHGRCSHVTDITRDKWHQASSTLTSFLRLLWMRCWRRRGPFSSRWATILSDRRWVTPVVAHSLYNSPASCVCARGVSWTCPTRNRNPTLLYQITICSGLRWLYKWFPSPCSRKFCTLSTIFCEKFFVFFLDSSIGTKMSGQVSFKIITAQLTFLGLIVPITGYNCICRFIRPIIAFLIIAMTFASMMGEVVVSALTTARAKAASLENPSVASSQDYSHLIDLIFRFRYSIRRVSLWAVVTMCYVQRHGISRVLHSLTMASNSRLEILHGNLGGKIRRLLLVGWGTTVFLVIVSWTSKLLVTYNVIVFPTTTSVNILPFWGGYWNILSG